MRRLLEQHIFGKGPPEGTLSFLGDLGFADDAELAVTRKWEQLGAETYSLEFSAQQDDKRLLFIAKACIKFFPTETMKEWVARRNLLSENGVATPTLHYRLGATLVEEHIPYTLAEVKKNG
jgi:hypothetical protein